MKVLNVLVCACLIGSFGCGDDDDPAIIQPSAAVTTAALSAEDVDTAKVKTVLTSMVAALQGSEAWSEFLTGKDPSADETAKEDCYDLTKTAGPPAMVTLTFTQGAGCLTQSGVITLTREGQTGSKYVLATIGETDKPMKVGGVFLWGHMRFDAKVAGPTDMTTSDKDGKAFSGDCDDKNDGCLNACLAGDTETKCPAEKLVKVGLKGTVTTKLNVAQKGVDVSIDAAGSIWAKTYSPKTNSSTALVQSLGVGASAPDSCSSEGFSTASSLTYFVPKDLKLSCACPSSGTVSSKGEVRLNVGIDCDKDQKADIESTVTFTGTGIEFEFDAASCGALKENVSCAGSSQLTYKDADFSKCLPSGVGCVLVKNALGCNADCSKCTRTEPTTLPSQLSDLTKLIDDQAKKLAAEYKDSATKACGVN